MEIIITKEDLQASRRFAAKADVRYYLNGVCFMLLHGAPVAVATDGHALAVLQLAESADLSDAPDGVIVPADTLDLVLKAARKGEALTITETLAGAVQYRPVDGKFPDITRVLPQEISGETAQFDPDLLARFKKAAKLLSGGYVTVAHNGQSAAAISVGHDRFAGVIIPMRIDAPAGVPAWALPKPEGKKADAA